jgi:hypothetical protein
MARFLAYRKVYGKNMFLYLQDKNKMNSCQTLGEDINYRFLHIDSGFQRGKISLQRPLGFDHIDLRPNNIAILDAFRDFIRCPIHQIEAGMDSVDRIGIHNNFLPIYIIGFIVMRN